MTRALLVIDVQNLLVAAKPYAISERLILWQEAIELCRKQQIEVIYVRHTDQEFVKGTEGWQIHSSLSPREDEMVVDKHYNSAFKDTNLHVYLQSKGITSLLICGMQTEYCIDTTVKVAFELGYQVAVVEGGTTTFGDEDIDAAVLIEHYENIWADCFAEVDFLEELLKEETE